MIAHNELEKERLARFKRVQQLRNLTGLSRLAFQEEFGISKGTMQIWEDPTPNKSGISAKGALRLASAMQEKGYNVTQEWIMYGIGNPPTLLSQINTEGIKHKIESNQNSEFFYMQEELQLFLKNHPNALHYTVNDDAMLPFYQIGDVVAGCRLTGDAIEKIIGKDCIVITEDGQLLFRYLKKGSLANTFTLVATNRESTVSAMTINDIKLVSAASVIFIRKPE